CSWFIGLRKERFPGRLLRPTVEGLMPAQSRTGLRARRQAGGDEAAARFPRAHCGRALPYRFTGNISLAPSAQKARRIMHLLWQLRRIRSWVSQADDRQIPDPNRTIAD